MAKSVIMTLRMTAEDRDRFLAEAAAAGVRAGYPVSVSAWALARLREACGAKVAPVKRAAPEAPWPAVEAPKAERLVAARQAVATLAVPLTDEQIAENRRRMLAPSKRGGE